MTTTIIRPLGRERAKIKDRQGRDHYSYDGIPEHGVVRHESLGIIPVWYFDYCKFEPDVQVLMAQRYADSHNCSFSDGVTYCKSHQHAIPCSHIALDPEPEATPES